MENENTFTVQVQVYLDNLFHEIKQITGNQFVIIQKIVL
ncbi:hypothetical protein BN997_01909 [Oceanobacillus oncorhynchi]|uniref:Uncharacterized protein n=1 Tax=Oceanobacillus oncorhynchi TaxID=545501 RepID=A0A0A1MQP6_9BACI|nr:hypothetical protein BN997_01909 [Oceanobacillus oncorhynchi]